MSGGLFGGQTERLGVHGLDGAQPVAQRPFQGGGDRHGRPVVGRNQKRGGPIPVDGGDFEGDGGDDAKPTRRSYEPVAHLWAGVVLAQGAEVVEHCPRGLSQHDLEPQQVTP